MYIHRDIYTINGGERKKKMFAHGPMDPGTNRF